MLSYLSLELEETDFRVCVVRGEPERVHEVVDLDVDRCDSLVRCEKLLVGRGRDVDKT